MELLFETTPLSSILNLEDPAVHAQRVHKMIKLDLCIDDNHSEDLRTASQEEGQAVTEVRDEDTNDPHVDEKTEKKLVNSETYLEMTDPSKELLDFFKEESNGVECVDDEAAAIETAVERAAAEAATQKESIGVECC